eukprot:XP_001705503.1 Hypothetical protein GL50803_34775 [Giardia lamblia ATCC 50803]
MAAMEIPGIPRTVVVAATPTVSSASSAIAPAIIAPAASSIASASPAVITAPITRAVVVVSLEAGALGVARHCIYFSPLQIL